MPQLDPGSQDPPADATSPQTRNKDDKEEGPREDEGPHAPALAQGAGPGCCAVDSRHEELTEFHLKSFQASKGFTPWPQSRSQSQVVGRPHGSKLVATMFISDIVAGF